MQKSSNAMSSFLEYFVKSCLKSAATSFFSAQVHKCIFLPIAKLVCFMPLIFPCYVPVFHLNLHIFCRAWNKKCCHILLFGAVRDFRYIRLVLMHYFNFIEMKYVFIEWKKNSMENCGAHKLNFQKNCIFFSRFFWPWFIWSG